MTHECDQLCAVQIKPNARTMAKIESEFRHLKDYKKSRSLLKKYLVKDLFNVLKNRVTSYGSTLLDVIISGVENLTSHVGVFAPDAEAYKVYHELFDQIIQEYHGTLQHTPVEFGFVDKIKSLDYENKYMISIKISCNRSLYGYPFNRRLSEEQFQQIETRVSRDLLMFEGNFKGTYLALKDMKKQEIDKFFQENYLLHSCDHYIHEAIGNRHWAIGRGVFCNKAGNFFVWINIEDHLCIVSKEEGGNLGACYRRLVIGLRKIEKQVAFLHDKRWGYINFCPTYLGTGMEIVAKLKLYNLPNYRNVIEEIASRYNLTLDLSCSDKCIFTCIVVYKPKLGMNEFQTIKWVQNAILHLIRTDIHINLNTIKNDNI